MLTCLQEPCHGHIITVPSCLIFCLNINRWVNISNFLCLSSNREFIWAREGYRIRASHWVCFQAICSVRLMSCSKITPCSYLARPAGLQGASHTKLQHWFKETTVQLYHAILLLVQNENFPTRSIWLKGPFFSHFANFSFHHSVLIWNLLVNRKQLFSIDLTSTVKPEAMVSFPQARSQRISC